MSRINDIWNLIFHKKRRLQKLKETQSKFGITTPPEVLIEIEDLEREIEDLERELKQLQAKDKEEPEDVPRGPVEPIINPEASKKKEGIFHRVRRYAKSQNPKLLDLDPRLFIATLLIIVLLVVIIISKPSVTNNPDPSPEPALSIFCINRSNSELLTMDDGTEIVVKPEEPLILSLCTADGTPVSFQTCFWKSSSTGHIDNPDSCVDAIYHAPKSDPDILTLTIKDTSTVNRQLSLIIIVKP